MLFWSNWSRAVVPMASPRAIIGAVEDSAPPHLLLLGSDAVQVVEGALDRDRAALAAWKSTSVGTDFTAWNGRDSVACCLEKRNALR